jgi:hypothetical protein
MPKQIIEGITGFVRQCGDDFFGEMGVEKKRDKAVQPGPRIGCFKFESPSFGDDPKVAKVSTTQTLSQVGHRGNYNGQSLMENWQLF